MKKEVEKDREGRERAEEEAREISRKYAIARMEIKEGQERERVE